MALPSRLDLLAAGRTYFYSRARRIDPGAVDVLGSDANLFVGSVASGPGSLLVAQIAAQWAAHSLENAEGEDLDRWVRDRLQEYRKGASPALVTLSFSRPAATLGAGAVDVGTRVAAPGAEYVTTSQATLSASGLSATCDARAVQAGREFQVGAHAINRVVQPNLLFDPSLRVDNPVAAAGGEPREEDDVFRERARKIIRNARRGTIGAIETGATGVPGVDSAMAAEMYGPIFYELGSYRSLGVATPVPARCVQLYIADGSGIANAALARAVDRAMFEWRPAGTQVVVLAGLPTIVPVRLRLAFSAGVDTAVLGELVRRAVVEFVNSLPVGTALERGALLALLRRYRTAGLVTGEGSLLEPAGDVLPAPGQTLRTSLPYVTLE